MKTYWIKSGNFVRRCGHPSGFAIPFEKVTTAAKILLCISLCTTVYQWDFLYKYYYNQVLPP